jgi:hypothetical protein
MHVKTNYFPLTSSGDHGMTAVGYANFMDSMFNRGGTLLDSVFYHANNTQMTPQPLGLTGYAYTTKKADWSIDFTIFDLDGDFSGQRIDLDVNSAAAKTMKSFYVDPVTGDLVGLSKTGHTVVIDGTFNADGNELTYCIDNEVLQDITGVGGFVKGQFAGEHFGDNGASSYFDIKIA